MKRIFFLAPAVVLLCALSALAQISPIDEAKDAINRGDYIRAEMVLAQLVAQRPSADAYLYLGIAYGHLREWDRAETTLRDGAALYRTDARFYNELGGVYLAFNNVEQAREALHQGLIVDPKDDFASDLLATLDMSEGNIQSALHFWNMHGRPVVGDIMQNGFLTFGTWTVDKAMAMRSGRQLSYRQWKTTEARLMETAIFSNTSLEVEPTKGADTYNANVRTTAKTNTLSDIMFDLFKGAPFKTTYLDVWNVGNSGVSFNSSVRWERTRRRGDLRMHAPLPTPGILFLDAKAIWRSEAWDLSNVIQPSAGIAPSLHYKSTGFRIDLEQIFDYRFSLGAGLEYRNRAAAGAAGPLAANSLNTGKFLLQTSLLPSDGVYRNRIHLEGFAARKKVLGDFNFTGGTAEVNNRLVLSADDGTFLDWTIKGGTARGQLPIEDYFVVGLDTQQGNLLRGHAASQHGKYGSAPMGTDFVLMNTDLEHRITVLPLFNSFHLPYLTVKAEVFVDSAKTFDRSRIFRQGKLLIDAGAGLKFEGPTHSLNLIYGRSLRDGTDLFFAYIEKRW